MFKRVILAVSACTGLTSIAHAGDAGNVTLPSIFERPAKLELFSKLDSAIGREQAVAAFWLASYGEDGAANRAVELFGDLPEIEVDPVARAYLAASYILRARDQSFIPARVVSVRRGLKHFAEAVAASPDNFEILALRGATTLNLPDIFGYRDTTRQDFDKILAMIEHGKAPVEDGSAVEGRMRAHLARLCLMDGDTACVEAEFAVLETEFGSFPDIVEARDALRKISGK